MSEMTLREALSRLREQWNEAHPREATYKGFARAAKLSEPTVRNTEDGTNPDPKLSTLNKWTTACGWRLSDLIRLIEPQADTKEFQREAGLEEYYDLLSEIFKSSGDADPDGFYKNGIKANLTAMALAVGHEEGKKRRNVAAERTAEEDGHLMRTVKKKALKQRSV